MKTIEEVAQEEAVKLGYFNFKDANEISSTFHMWIYVEKCMQEYARQCCEEQKQQCSENFDLDSRLPSGFPDINQVKKSILNTPNVVK